MWNASRTCLLLLSIPFWLAGEEGECRTGPVSHNSLSLVTGKFRIGERKVAEAGKLSHSAVFWKVQLILVKALFFLAPGPVSFWVISEKQPKGVFQHLISRLASIQIILRIWNRAQNISPLQNIKQWAPNLLFSSQCSARTVPHSPGSIRTDRADVTLYSSSILQLWGLLRVAWSSQIVEKNGFAKRLWA